MLYKNPISLQDNQDQTIGILITNVGTPEAPTKEALKPYLKEFLQDNRVVEAPNQLWWKIVLNLFILTTRPAKSAVAYEEVWGKYGKGSPLLDICNDQLIAIKKNITESVGQRVELEVGMGYGNPSIASSLQKLASKGCTKFIVLPLFPQYTSATIGSTFEGVTKELQTWRWVPELRFITGYHNDKNYTLSLANSIREHQQKHGKPDLLVISFHGIPKKQLEAGDPYYKQCMETAKMLVSELALADNDYKITFQSLFGKEEWIKPYTDATMKELPGLGIKNIQVVCPGFSADCLETIEEINQENREYFEENGGEKFSYIPALNTRKDHTDALSEIIKTNLKGW